MKSEDEADRAVYKYADTVRRICFMHLKNHSDVEDVFQEVFMKYVFLSRDFESEAHEKAWIIRVSINCCKDLKKSFLRRRVSLLEDIPQSMLYAYAEHEEYAAGEEGRNLLNAVLALPEKYKNVVYLYYYEGYNAAEIAKILGTRENTVYTRLARARERLREMLGGDLL